MTKEQRGERTIQSVLASFDADGKKSIQIGTASIFEPRRSIRRLASAVPLGKPLSRSLKVA